MAAVDHDVQRDFRLVQVLLAERDADRIVVRLAVAAAQHHVTVAVALGGHDGYAALLVDAEEAMRAGDRLQGIDRHGQAAIGAVLEADRGRQAGGHLAVGLRFGGTGADRRPTDQVLQVLRGNRVERFGGGGQAFLGEVAEQLATDVQAILDLERVVQVRIVDQAFPAHRGTRLLEVHAHHQEQRICHFGRERLEAVGVFVGGLDVVDGAGADHHEQTVVLAIQNVAHHLATMGHGLQRLVGQGNFTLELLRRDQGLVGGNVKVVDL